MKRPNEFELFLIACGIAVLIIATVELLGRWLKQ